MWSATAHFCHLLTQGLATTHGSFNCGSAAPTGPWHAICYKLHSPRWALLGFSRSKGGSQMTRYPREHTIILQVEDACCHLLKHIPHEPPRWRRGKGASELCFRASACLPCSLLRWYSLQQRMPKGEGFKADVWYFTIKTLPPFFQWRRKSLTSS